MVRIRLFSYPGKFYFYRMKRKSDVLAERLLSKGCIIRPGSQFDCPASVRITIGSSVQNDNLIAHLSKLLQMQEMEI